MLVFKQKKALFLLLTIFLLKGLLYAFLFPLWQAPDEPGHYQYIVYNASLIFSNFKADPLYTTRLIYLGKPTFYYWVGAFFILPFKNSSPLTRAYVLRLFNVFLNLGVIYLAYKTAKKVLPNEPLIALATPFFITMLPMFNHTGSATNSDNLAHLIFAAFIYLSVYSLMEGLTLSRGIFIVSLVILGLLTKRTTFTAVLLFFILLLLTFFKKPATREWLKQNSLKIAITFGVFLLALPFINLLSLKFTQVNIFAFAQSIPDLATGSLSDKLRQPFTIFTMTFWGDFGWANVPLAFHYYAWLNRVWLLPVIGLLVVFWQVFKKKLSFNRLQILALLFLFLTLFLILFTVLLFQPLWQKTPNWMPQARYAWVALVPLFFFFSFGTLLPFQNKIVPFITLSLAAILYETAVLFKVVIPHYYLSLFSFSGVKLADKYSASLRPAFLNSSFFYLALFAFVYTFLIFFIYQAVKENKLH